VGYTLAGKSILHKPLVGSQRDIGHGRTTDEEQSVVVRYNIPMDVDPVRIACPACGTRLSVMPRVQYIACTHCGSEYLVQRRGSAVGLEPFAAEQYELSRKIADVEKSQGEGCSNVFFWIFLVAFVFFCVLGFLGRTAFGNNNTLLVLGWAVSLFALVLAAGILLRTLNTQRIRRQKLEARKQALYEAQPEAGPPEALEGGANGPQASAPPGS
jgi:DNA-directed RNA polymerase subunit RPC12/RpoP